jgi:hypothetical protein
MTKLEGIGSSGSHHLVDEVEGVVHNGAIAAIPLGDNAGRREPEIGQAPDGGIWQHEPLAGFHHVGKLFPKKSTAVDCASMRSSTYGGVEFFGGPVGAGDVDWCADVAKVAKCCCRRMRNESTTCQTTAAPMTLTELNECAGCQSLDRSLHQRT